MHDGRTRRLARQALAAGESLSSVSRRTGVSRATLRDWRNKVGAEYEVVDCPLCAGRRPLAAPYAYLLGLYLGDGCLSEGKKQVYALRIACDTKYPRLIDEAATAIAVIHPSRPVHRIQAVGYTSLVSYWKHWS
ncbi:transposase [Kribbella sp. NPDC056861]|uniref:transposase n=1 Tax=Kribbella sp. NPDC056861 TaxID=3154857 RepID=UPI003417E292